MKTRSLINLIGTMSGLTAAMFILKVRVDVKLLRMRMVLHGNLLMKLLVHQARCEAAIFKGKPATTSMQEMDL